MKASYETTSNNGVPLGQQEGGEVEESGGNQNALFLLQYDRHALHVGALLAAGGINAAMQAASCSRPAAMQLPQLAACWTNS